MVVEQGDLTQDGQIISVGSNAKYSVHLNFSHCLTLSKPFQVLTIWKGYYGCLSGYVMNTVALVTI